MAEEDEEDPYVIVQKSIGPKRVAAEVSVHAYSEIVRRLEQAGLLVSGEHAARADTMRIEISGHSETVNHAIGGLLEQYPQMMSNIQGFESPGASAGA